MIKQTIESLGINIQNLWLLGLIQSAIILVGFFFLFTIVLQFVFSALSRYIKSTSSIDDVQILIVIQKFLRSVLLLIAVQLVVSSFPLPVLLLVLIDNTVFVLIALLVLKSVFKLTDLLIPCVGKGNAKEFVPLLTRAIKVLTFFIVLMGVMRHFSYDIWHIVTALGIGSLAIGLAAQPTLSNMISGFTILIDRPFLPSNRISLTGGDTGEVIQIGMRSTQILTPDGNILIVPNNELSNSRVTNFNLPDNRLSQKFKLNFDLSSDTDRIKHLLKSCLEKTPGIMKDTTKAHITNVSDWAVEITVFYNAERYTETNEVTDRAITGALHILKENNIQLAMKKFSLN
ncbi:MAG: mechanosensitive ion channel [Oligoflexia bacterium]|nr:mechanosensitive ion channel [Oligoflexia bacterium]